jgi:hypothetical protein
MKGKKIIKRAIALLNTFIDRGEDFCKEER